MGFILSLPGFLLGVRQGPAPAARLTACVEHARFHGVNRASMTARSPRPPTRPVGGGAELAAPPGAHHVPVPVRCGENSIGPHCSGRAARAKSIVMGVKRTSGWGAGNAASL